MSKKRFDMDFNSFSKVQLSFGYSLATCVTSAESRDVSMESSIIRFDDSAKCLIVHTVPTYQILLKCAKV